MASEEQLKKGAGDYAHLVVKSALSAVPVAGGPLAELFAFLIAEPLAKRRDQLGHAPGYFFDPLSPTVDDKSLKLVNAILVFLAAKIAPD